MNKKKLKVHIVKAGFLLEPLPIRVLKVVNRKNIEVVSIVKNGGEYEVYYY